RRPEGDPARVLEAIARIEVGLLAHHALALHLLHLARAIADDPVAAQELRRLLAHVGDAGGVGEGVTALARVGVLLPVLGLDLDADPLGDGDGHGLSLPESGDGSNRPALRPPSAEDALPLAKALLEQRLHRIAHTAGRLLDQLRIVRVLRA